MTPHRTCRNALAAGAVLAVALSGPGAAIAQTIDMSHGGPVEVTARDGMEWRRTEQMVIANGSARAVRGNVTVTADRLIARYRRKAATGAAAANGAAGAAPSGATPGTGAAGGGSPAVPLAGGSAPAPVGTPAQGLGSTDADTGSNEIYRLEAEGNVHIFTATDLIVADKAVYDIDQAVLLLTGSAMKLTTPQQVLTARDSMEYWSAKHMAVGRGMATVTTADGRRVTGDTLVGYTKVPDAAPGPKPAGAAPAKPGTDPLASSGKLERVEGVRQRRGPHRDRGDPGGARRVRPRHRHRAPGRLRSPHPGSEPVERGRGHREHADRDQHADAKPRRARAGTGDPERPIEPRQPGVTRRAGHHET